MEENTNENNGANNWFQLLYIFVLVLSCVSDGGEINTVENAGTMDEVLVYDNVFSCYLSAPTLFHLSII